MVVGRGRGNPVTGNRTKQTSNVSVFDKPDAEILNQVQDDGVGHVCCLSRFCLAKKNTVKDIQATLIRHAVNIIKVGLCCWNVIRHPRLGSRTEKSQRFFAVANSSLFPLSCRLGRIATNQQERKNNSTHPNIPLFSLPLHLIGSPIVFIVRSVMLVL